MKTLVLIPLILSLAAAPLGAETLEERLRELEETIRRQSESLLQQQKALEELKGELKTRTAGAPKAEPSREPAPPPRDYLRDDRSRGIYAPTASPIIPYTLTPPKTPSLANPAIELVLDTLYYSSSLSPGEVATRNIPGFLRVPEAFREGFNLRAAEFSIFAPVDPYFNLYATIPITEDGAEVEEAYFLTTSLPAGFQGKGGKFRSGFGRLNAFHPHDWDFVDDPLPYRLFIGGQGLIEKGAQLTYLPNLPIYTLLGAEVLQGDNDLLFGPGARSGPHAYVGFIKASLDFGVHHTILFGGSVAGGQTRTSSFAPATEFRGDSLLYGLEFTHKWKIKEKRRLLVQSEYLLRHQKGDLIDSAAARTDSLRRTQDGWYIYSLYQLDRWRIGARYDLMEIFQNDVNRAERKQVFSGRPYRLAGVLEFNPTEFSRIRLQYNYDRSAPADKENHEVFLQFILGVGAHGAHPF